MKDKLYVGHKRTIRKYLKDNEEELAIWFKDGGKITKEFMELLGFEIVPWEFRYAGPPLTEEDKYHCVKRFGNKKHIAIDINFVGGKFCLEYCANDAKFLKKTGSRNILKRLENIPLEFPGEIINVINTVCLEGDSKYIDIMNDNFYYKLK